MNTTELMRDGATVVVTPRGKRAGTEIRLGNVGAAALKPVDASGRRVQAQRITVEGMRNLEGAKVTALGQATKMHREAERPADLRGRVAPEGWRERVIGRLDIPVDEHTTLKIVVEARLIEVDGDVARLRAYAEFRVRDGEREATWNPKDLPDALAALGGEAETAAADAA